MHLYPRFLKEVNAQSVFTATGDAFNAVFVNMNAPVRMHAVKVGGDQPYIF
ncbi:MAG: hypothetical protein UY50_C0006G0039 [Parcubacteria group bacterium GW2011_GWA2_49_9]|nr:MAG: hypothetical protein UY50_C0006G0039 [Parcubacteria group bacterium GW2011_GWA2_49_9]